MARAPVTAWLLLRRTVADLFRDRVTGLAAEAAFFALLSLPPLLFGLVGTLGYFGALISPATIAEVRANTLEFFRTVLSAQTVDAVVRPILDDVLSGGRPDLVSAGFVLSVWSGSRALHVYVDTITLAYRLSGRRSIVRARLLSLSLYAASLVIGVVLVPLVVAGPQLVDAATREGSLLDAVGHAAYWPVVVVVSVVSLTTLYHVAVPCRTPWWKDLPGAFLALLIWLLGSALLRLYLGSAMGGQAAYGVLAAPVAVLLWMYVTALAVLIGAELNAAIDTTWPSPTTATARRLGPRYPDMRALSIPQPCPPHEPCPPETPARSEPGPSEPAGRPEPSLRAEPTPAAPGRPSQPAGERQ